MASNPTNTTGHTGGLDEKKYDRRSTSSGSASGTAYEHEDRVGISNQQPNSEKARLGASKKLANPLAGLSPERLEKMGAEYAQMAGLTSEEDVRAFRLGARIAGDESNYDTMPELTEREKEVLVRETTHKWSNPPMLYWVVVSTLLTPCRGPKLNDPMLTT